MNVLIVVVGIVGCFDIFLGGPVLFEVCSEWLCVVVIFSWE